MKSALDELRLTEGRDEMNLADFPISALQRVQKEDGQGGKLARMEFFATRYDSASRQRVTQKVTLTSTAADGLPTPADEHVILALLFVGKHSNDFTDATVHFAPTQLFTIMGWAPNGRSYTRLRDVLRRLKSLTIRYENAWWDAAGRQYEEEVATGIISGYRIGQQVSGPRTAETELASSVTWTQQFHESLRKGNIKRLDLETFFKLSSPTAQRMYRFLDKRFYNTDVVAMDLVEFACGHVGLAEVDNIAILKRRLVPAIEELESIGFIEKAEASQRYQKLKVGQWRVTFRKPPRSTGGSPVDVGVPASAGLPAVGRPAEAGTPTRAGETPALREEEVGETPRRETRRTPEAIPATPALELAREFYRLWDATANLTPGPRDLEQASLLLAGREPTEAKAIIECLVRVTRKQWPDCRSLSGAAQKYLGDALKLRQAELRREAEREQMRRQREQPEPVTNDAMQARWEALSVSERAAIEARVRERAGNIPAVFVRRLCLQELAKVQ